MSGVRVDGDFSKTSRWLKGISKKPNLQLFAKYGEAGVRALSKATPVDTGKTADSWFYEIAEGDGRISVNFYNSNVNRGVNIAIILQFGHATRNGGWVQGIDYINPALKPVFKDMAKDAWEEVKKI